MQSDKGRKYQTFNKELKTKTEINNQYYFKYIKDRKWNEYNLPSISEEEFFNRK